MGRRASEKESMEFGVFNELPRLEGRSEAVAFADGLALVDAGEQWGIDVLWLAEFHLNARSVVSSPLAIAAAIAGRTERMRIGTAVQVLPLGNPLRLTEEWATVDQISRGRLIFGVGRASSPRSYVAYGIPYAESRDRFAEALTVIRSAWTEPTFSYEGTYYRYLNVSVSPRPYQQPYPPIRVAATSSDTFPALGTQGFDILTAMRLGPTSELAADLERYHAAYRAAGHPGAGKVYLRIPIYVAETMEQAIAEPEQSLMQAYHDAAIQLTQTPGVRDALAPDVRAHRARALASLTYEEARREKVIVGTPVAVVDRIQQLRDAFGIDGILAELNCGRQIPTEQVLRSLRLLCTEVMPRFR